MTNRYRQDMWKECLECIDVAEGRVEGVVVVVDMESQRQRGKCGDEGAWFRCEALKNASVVGGRSSSR